MAELMVYGTNKSGKTVAFSSVLEFFYENNRFTPADILKITVLDSVGDDPIVSLTAKSQGRTFFEGIVDQQKIIRGIKGNYCQLTCRSQRGAWLLDNEARPQTASFFTAGQLFADHLLPFGVCGHRMTAHAILSDFLISKGSSHWDVVTLFCQRAFGKLPYLDRENYLSLDPYSGREVIFSNRRQQAVPYQNLEIIQDNTRMISRLYVKTTQTQQKTAYYGGQIKNELADSLGIRRVRYYHPGKEWGSEIREGAQAVLRERQQDFWSAEVTVPGILDVCAGDLAQLWETDFVKTSLYVSRVQIQADADGIFTRVRLWDKSVL